MLRVIGTQRTRLSIVASILVALIVGCFAACFAACDRKAEPPPRFGQVPAFSLIDQRGQTVTLGDFQAKLWIVDFIFTTCPDICPMLTQQLAALRKDLPRDPRLRFVSISVDPDYDTPERLRAFAELHGANHPDWYFLTGDANAVKRVVTEGFKQAMQAVSEEEGRPRNVLHGTHFVLVDGGGTIRGFHRTEGEGLAETRAAALALLAEERAP